MIDPLDIDIFRTANVIIKRYGDDAWQRAVEMAAKFKRTGDEGGAAVWYR